MYIYIYTHMSVPVGVLRGPLSGAPLDEKNT